MGGLFLLSYTDDQLLVRILAIFAVAWIHILVFVVIQNTITVSYFSQPVTFTDSVTIDGSLYVSGTNPTNWNNITQFTDNGYVFVSSSVNDTNLGTIATTWASEFTYFGIVTTPRVSLPNGLGMWTNGAFYTQSNIADVYLFADRTAMKNNTLLSYSLPTTPTTIPPSSTLKIELDIVEIHTTVIGFQFVQALPDDLSPVVYIENTTLTVKFQNINPTVPIVLGANSVVLGVVTMDWYEQNSNTVCQLLACTDAWCSFTLDENNSCFRFNCC